MFRGEFNFDLEEALSSFDNQYSMAYTFTNEPIEKYLDLIPVKNKRILTTAASGDQAMMYLNAGASTVDTFDITVFACAVMDFKTTALQMVTYQEYLKSVNCLKKFAEFNYTKNIDYHRTMRIVANMPERTRILTQQAIQQELNVFERDMYNTIQHPNDARTYAQMQQNIKKPFNFIWADLENVSRYLDTKYDIINTSNIFEHYLTWWQNKPRNAIIKTIESLLPHLHDGGCILCLTSGNCDSDIQKTLTQHQEILKNMNAKLSFPWAHRNSYFTPIIIQKIR